MRGTADAGFSHHVGAESPGGHVRDGSVDEVGEDGFDDRVAAVGDVGVGGRFGGVGENG